MMYAETSDGRPHTAVEVRGLVKEFKGRSATKVRAVDGVSFEVQKGEVFGFLGPNGEGKTTTTEIIEGLQSPSAGSSSVLGMDSVYERDEMKKGIGVQLQAAAYFDHLTLEEILDLFGSFYPRRLAADGLLDKVNLLEKRKSLVRELSGDLISMINKRDEKTVVLTTHYMEEAQILCDRVAIIDAGKIQALDTPFSLIRGLPDAYRILISADRSLDEEALAGLPEVNDVLPHSNGAFSWELKVAKAHVTLPALLRWASRRKAQVEDVQVLPAVD